MLMHFRLSQHFNRRWNLVLLVSSFASFSLSPRLLSLSPPFKHSHTFSGKRVLGTGTRNLTSSKVEFISIDMHTPYLPSSSASSSTAKQESKKRTTQEASGGERVPTTRVNAFPGDG